MAMSGSTGSQPDTVARLLEEIRGGNRSAFDKLVPLVYEELRELAHAQRRSWRGDDTLDTNALAHEAYLKLAAQDVPDWESHAHFRSVAARAMRQILIDYAKARRAEKRGGERVRVTLDEIRLAPPGTDSASQQAELLIVLDESLKRLTDENERQSRIVECRFFGGMTVPDTAAALGISRATVKRGWAMAKAWLYRDMQQGLAR
jgi:RNA polymerase sigma factor (TIGR02999 family)